MRNKIILSILIFLSLIINACAPPIESPIKETDKGPAGVDVVRETSKIKVVDEEQEVEEETIEEVNEEETSEVKELLSIADEKVESISYKYKGPDTKDFFYDFFVRENKIKYVLSPPYKVIDIDDDAYDAIYINKESETALAFCEGRKCRVKGKKASLDYDEMYILTPLDWLNKVESAEKLGEEVIGKRNTWKLSTNDFTIWIDTFFGVPLQVESAGNKYEFQKMSFNDVKDEDVDVKS